MDLVSVQCPGCGANLPARAPTGDYVCDYCSSRFQAAQARSAHTLAGQQIDVRQLAAEIVAQQQRQQAGRRLPAGPPVVQYGAPGVASPAAMHQAQMAAQTAASAGRRIGCVVALVSLLGVAAPGVIIAMQQGAFDKLANIGGIGELVESVEHLLWDHVGGGPRLVEIGGKSAFIGRTRKVLDGDQLFIDAYDAQSVKRLWRIGPLGSYSEAYQAVHFAAVGDRLVLSDAKAQVHLHDLATGERVKSLSLTDKVGHMCVPPGQAKKVWIKQIDEKSNLLDLASGALEPSPLPTGCFESQWDAERAAQDKLGEGAPQIDGIAVKQVLVDGDKSVVLGVKSPGTPVPHAVGWDAKARKPLWDVVVASVDAATIRQEDAAAALAGGRVYVAYGAGQEDWYLAAFDAKNGTRVWEHKLRSLFAVDWIKRIDATKGQVLVGRTSSMEVYDAATGKLLGTVGTETYD